MGIGDVEAVRDCEDLYFVDTGMYDTAGYGSVYVLDAERPAVIDTGIGTEADRVIDAVESVGVGRDELAYVLPTHVHLDHAGGAGFLCEAFPEATVLTHERGVRHLVDPSRLVAGTKAAVGDQWEFYVEPRPVPAGRVDGLADGDVVDLGDRHLEATAAPGHAPHQVTFHDDADDVVFTGDAAGIYLPAVDEVRQTTPPPQFDLERARADARAIEARDPAVLAFGHFGPRPFEPAVTEGYRRTLVEWVEAVRAKRAGLADDDAVADHFAATVDERAIEAWGSRKARAEERLNVRGVLSYLDSLAE
jgi:glyoxylase-like metal-dependent hydrolase (beta-lactamase superfamily II)